MSRRIKIFLWSSSFILILAIFFTFALPAILRNVLESQIEKNLHRPATVESVSFNPFTLCLSVRGLTIREPDDSEVFFSFEQLLANLEIASVIKNGIILNEVTLVKPHVHIVHTKANQYNFSDMLTAKDEQTKKPAEKESTEPLFFSIANIRLIDGSIEFDDRLQNVVHHITDIAIGLPLVSNFKKNVGVFVEPSFSATIEGRTFQLNGQTKPFADSQETDFNLQLENLNLAQYLPYVPAQLNFTMPSGSLSAKLKLRYVQKDDSSTEIKLKGDISLADLTLIHLDNSPLINIPSFAVSGIDCALNKRELIIDDISLNSLSLALVREKGGTILLKQLFADTDTTEAEEPTPETDADDEPAWSVLVKKFTSTAATINFEDLIPPQPTRFTVDNFNISLFNLSTTGNTPADLDLICRINNESTLGVKGTLALAPPSANLDIELNELDIRFAQNYFPDTLQLDLNSGTLGIKGGLAFKQTDTETPSVVWKGDILLAGVAAKKSGTRDTMLKFTSLDLRSMRVSNTPTTINVKTLNLAGLYLRTVIETNGTFNLMSLSTARAEPQTAPPKTQATKESLPRINIGSVVLKKGRVTFTDKSIKPRYTTELADITGRIKSISSKPESQADIRLDAKLNRYAPFAVRGTISPLQKKLKADILVKFDNIDLSPFSPYAGKFIGRNVKKGTLSLDLNYAIQDNQLTSQNRFFIDQMTLGEKVDSKDATRLPVGLAISLLKNREGAIELDLPVSGSLDDPTFRVRKVLLKTLINLLEKAATSPFALVGALIPNGTDVSSIAFPCGTAKLDSTATKKLDAIAGLLTEKTDLRLEIQPIGEMNIDTESLRREMVMLRIQQLKFKKMSKRQRKETVPEQLSISDDEYKKYLWPAYKAEKFKKPKGALGLTKRLPIEEMERLLTENMQVNDEDINELVDRRGLAVKQYLNETAKISPGRLFIVNSRVEPGDNPAGCAVEFNLK